MPKNKRKNVPDLQELLDRPICYYCDKDFEDLKYLVDHQKAKHFKCTRCNRRLNTAGGLGVHLQQVHKEKLEKIENAVEGRESPGIEVFGMIGYPEEVLAAHKTRVTNEYFRREAEHRARTGNPPPGTRPNAEQDSVRNESIEDMKKRLEVFKAKRAAEKAAAANSSGSEGNTPGATAESTDAGPQINQAAQITQEAGSPPSNLPPAQTNRNIDLGNGGVAYLRSFEVSSVPRASAATNQQPPVAPFPMYATSSMPPHSMYPTAAGPNHHSMMSMPPMPPKPFNQGWTAGPTKTDPQYSPTAGPPPGISTSGSPPPPGSLPRQNSLPSAPGLPQRPAFDSPNVSKEDMARMHVSSQPGNPGFTQVGYSNAPQMPPGAYGAPTPHGGNPPYGAPPGPYGAPGPQYGSANPPFSAPFSPQGPPAPPWAVRPPSNGWYPPQQQGAAHSPPPSAPYIGDQVDELIQSVTGERPAYPSHQQMNDPSNMPPWLQAPTPQQPVEDRVESDETGSPSSGDEAYHGRGAWHRYRVDDRRIIFINFERGIYVNENEDYEDGSRIYVQNEDNGPGVYIQDERHDGPDVYIKDEDDDEREAYIRDQHNDAPGFVPTMDQVYDRFGLYAEQGVIVTCGADREPVSLRFGNKVFDADGWHWDPIGGESRVDTPLAGGEPRVEAEPGVGGEPPNIKVEPDIKVEPHIKVEPRD